MSNYTQNVSFGPKDSLTPGDAAKRIKGTEIDAELSEIATAIASKEDTANKGAASGYAGLGTDGLVPVAQLPVASETVQGVVELATTAEAVTGTDTARAVTPAGLEAWAAQNGGMVQDIANLADPNADRILFWDDSAGAVVALALGTYLTITGTTLDVNGSLTYSAVGAAAASHTHAATDITSGTLADARLSTNIAKLDSTQTFTGDKTFSGTLTYGSYEVGWKQVPQNSQTGNYTCVLGDAGKHILHPTLGGSGDTFTIPANSSVAYPIGTTITFINRDTAAVSIAITTDTMYLANSTSTGTRTLAQNGIATAIKVESTVWIISGSGLS